MLRIRVQASGAGAGRYFAPGGGEGDADGPTPGGVWGGRAAARLGLVGAVGAGEFARLGDNRHPATDEPLTPRTSVVRRAGWDVSFHAPKSLSLLYGLTGNPQLLRAFSTATTVTMAELEADARTRVRRAGADADRVTGNLAWAAFVHTTARPVNGAADPHLHAHCFLFNLTFDPVEGRFKAVQPDFLYRDAPYFQAVFHARLAAGVRALGFNVYRTSSGWEVAGLPPDLLRAFSRRTEQIERAATVLGVSHPRALDALGARTREGRGMPVPFARLQRGWQERLTPDERRAVLAVMARRAPAARDPSAAGEAVEFAVAHLFERAAVVGERELLAAALKVGVGRVRPDEVAAELPRHDLIVRVVAGERLVTTPEVVREERGMVAFARDGRGRCRPLAPPDRPLTNARLSTEQGAAVRQVLASTDRVTLVRGAAGTGKTTVMAECVRGIEDGGRPVVVLAPSADAARGALRRDGFAAADTVARFLLDARFQLAARGGVIWVDEAGLLGGRDAARLFRLAGVLGARVVLGGDRRQHSPVPRGSVMRLLETEAGLASAAVTAIRRQAGRYREAVSLLSRGRAAAGFDVLNDLGWVRELDDSVRPATLAAEYLEAVRAGESVLVVAPTHAEGRAVTAAVRAVLRTDGRLETVDQVVARLEARDATVAERGRYDWYTVGEVVEFHRPAPGFRPGERWVVVGVGLGRVEVRAHDGRQCTLPLHLGERFGVYLRCELPLAAGDRVRVTKNGRAADGRRLDNGSLHTVARVRADGGVVLGSGVVLPPGFSHLAHGYAATSPASQGKTVDVVLVAESTRSFAAAGREQLYVSVSRGRRRAVVFTDDAAALRRAVERSDPRPTAAELLAAVPSAPVWRAWRERRVRTLRWPRLAGRAVEVPRTPDPGRETGRGR